MNEKTPRILITGATSGIGKACAIRLAARGAALMLTGRSDEKLEETAAACGSASTLLTHVADLTAPKAAEALFQMAESQLHGVDIVIHAAGVGLIKPIQEITDAEFSRVLNVNTRVTFLVLKEACRVMSAQKRGRFITFPGILGRAVMKNAAAYIASKFAVSGLLKAAAAEYTRFGVQFTALHFGGVDTPFYDQLGMAVQREKMIPVDTAADLVLNCIDTPSHLVMNEMVIQPEVHQLG